MDFFRDHLLSVITFTPLAGALLLLLLPVFRGRDDAVGWSACRRTRAAFPRAPSHDRYGCLAPKCRGVGSPNTDVWRRREAAPPETRLATLR